MYVVQYFDSIERKVKFTTHTTWGGAYGSAKAIQEQGYLDIHVYEEVQLTLR